MLLEAAKNKSPTPTKKTPKIHKTLNKLLSHPAQFKSFQSDLKAQTHASIEVDEDFVKPQLMLWLLLAQADKAEQWLLPTLVSDQRVHRDMRQLTQLYNLAY